jgi:hypothetical protein
MNDIKDSLKYNNNSLINKVLIYYLLYTLVIPHHFAKFLAAPVHVLDHYGSGQSASPSCHQTPFQAHINQHMDPLIFCTLCQYSYQRSIHPLLPSLCLVYW